MPVRNNANEADRINKMKERQKKNRNENFSTVDLIKFLLFIVILANMIFAVVMFLDGDISEVKDFAVRTGMTFLSNAILLLFVELLERMERKRWKKKAQLDSSEGEYRLLKCSGGYFMFPLVTIFLDVLMGAMTLKAYRNNADEVKQFLQSEEIVFPACYLLLLNVVCVFVILYYCCYKVYYTGHFIGLVHFIQKKKISCAEIQKIEYSSRKQGKKVILWIETKDTRLKLCSETLSDGWEEFVKFIKETAKKYDIKINRKNGKEKK